MSDTPPEEQDASREPEPATDATPRVPAEPPVTPQSAPQPAATPGPAATPASGPLPTAPVWPGPAVPGYIMPGQRVPQGAIPVPGQPMPPGLVWPVPAPRPAPKPTPMQKHWHGPATGARRVTLSAILVSAIVGAMSLVLNRPGLGFLITGVVITGSVVVTARAERLAREAASATETTPAEPATAPPAASSATTPAPAAEPAAAAAPGESAASAAPAAWSIRRNGERTCWTAITLALLAVGTFRDSGWLFFLCFVVALGTGSIALAGGRAVRGLLLALVTWFSALFTSPPWFIRGVRAARQDRGGPRVVLAAAISIGLLLVFGGLFAAADAEFAHVLASILPKWTAADVFRAIFCFVVVFMLALSATYLAASRPTYSDIRPGVWRSVRRIEWVLPLAVLNVLFAGFVYIQLTVLFTGDAKLSAKSHDYMKGYAHSGFWQLVVVSLLTLTVIAVTSRIASRETRSDRILVRVLLGGLSVFSIVIVASALKRLAAYEHAYGYTRVRVVVGGFELWLGVLFLLILVAGIRLRGGWLPQVIAGSFAVALFAGAIANPDYYVASHNVSRYQDTGKFSVEYMQQLSADAVPAIEELPTRLRNCSLRPIAVRLAEHPDDWRTWNFSRVDARDRIGVFDLATARSCPDLVGKR